MAINYFFKHQADQYAFIRIPKIMMTEDIFEPLSMEAKVLYGMLLDMMSESPKHRWVDDKNRVFIIYPISKIQEDMRVSKGKAIKCLQELEDIGLIAKKHRGQKQPDYIYVKDFMVEQKVVNLF
ncbi:Replication initiator protein A (RepA) N-terminus [Pseudobutyrivibrio sp. YE44]|uniref:replication initiator protein A n=1 Tax=Pseudobutyrivibrio sp. YE44 TaxID=1520802 RepID=UPI00087E259F|nr:replication initiator protein A [Pseudobutyrivibrio sp. YE44]SDB44708.1 Replication initiator protein A (RepA) N-terminus [Pseudobutyrivibrio sp. YE44]